jgi:hypothetical protein
VTRDLSASITVAADVVTFVSPPTPAVDVCYNFVLSRPITLDLSGYYPSNIQFAAVAASGKPVNFSAPALAGTGLSLSNVSANVVQLSGIPDTITPLTTVTVTASAIGTPATASRTFKLAVLNDSITISDVSASLLVFVQNRAITPIQLSASTLSGRPVTSFTSANLPTGVTLSTTGLLAGTPSVSEPLGNTFTVTASTGFASQTKTYSYTTIQDNILVVIPTTTVTVSPVFSNVEFDILSYSGADGSLTSYYGPQGIEPNQSTMATLSTTAPNLLGGNFGNVPVLAPEYRFNVEGAVGSLTSLKQVNAVVSPAPIIQHSAILADTIVYPNTVAIPPPIPAVAGRIVVSTDSPTSFAAPSSVGISLTGPSVWTTTYSFTAQGPGYDMARCSNVFIAVFGSNIIRSTDYGNTWTQIASSNITTLSDVFGMQYAGLPDPTVPGPPRARFTNPTFGAVVSDGTSNWWAMGIGTSNAPPPTPAGYWAPVSVIRRSTDNGLTWSDTLGPITGTLSPSIMQFTRLFYNQGRLFYTGRQRLPLLQSNAFSYADVSDITTWTKPLTTLDAYGAILGVGFSNSTAVAVGTDSNASALFVSTDNGTNWSTGTNPNPGPSGSYDNIDLFQRYGTWFLGGLSNGFVSLNASRDLTVWQDRTVSPYPGSYSVTTENGITWVSGGPNNQQFLASRWQDDGTTATGSTITSSLATGIEFKRLYSDVTYNPSNPTLTFSIPYDASGIAFTSPTQTQFTNWQYVPVSTIPVVASNPVPGSFLYYYASGLPRGLTLNLDASGVSSTITGTSSQYSDAFQRVILYAALNPGGGGGGVAALPITMRTILPTVQKQQTSAGAWTSLVRQYTVVNAAENSINGRALPATEPPLGEFTRPYPPDEVSAPGDPNCRKC